MTGCENKYTLYTQNIEISVKIENIETIIHNELCKKSQTVLPIISTINMNSLNNSKNRLYKTHYKHIYIYKYTDDLLFEELIKIMNKHRYITTLKIVPLNKMNILKYNDNKMGNYICNIIDMCGRNKLPNIKKIDIVFSMDKLYTIRSILASNLLKIYGLNENECKICCDNIGFYFYNECGHSGFCSKCITHGDYNIEDAHICPFCKTKSKISKIPTNIKNICHGINKKYYFYSNCKCVLLNGCNVCVKNYIKKNNFTCEKCGDGIINYQQLYI